MLFKKKKDPGRFKKVPNNPLKNTILNIKNSINPLKKYF